MDRSGAFRILAAVTLLATGTAYGIPFLHRKPATPHPIVNRVLRAGDAAPDFNLPTEDAVTVSLKDFRGKWLVLYFCPSDESPGCTIEAHNFQRDLPQFEKAQAVVVGASPDSPSRHKAFITQQELTFKLVTDRKRKLAKRYGAGLRHAIMLKRFIRATFLIDPQGRIARIWMAPDPRHHSTEVLAALEKK